jgi:pyruvate/2-oxoglutarate dehydrogenase complex dihydrolipoamide dehydrogenase (E3) component
MHTRHENYDAVVIGSGQAGEPLAIEFARAGLHTALLEGFEFGEDCVDSGCAPSKSLIASANVAHLARKAPAFGVHTGSVEVDFGKVQMRKQALMDGLRTEAMRALSATPDLTVLKGETRFESAGALLVREPDGAVLELNAPKIFINTGARPALPNLPGLADVPYLTSSSAMELDELPDHLLVLGGSYLGVELGQMFRRFGSSVSIIERQSQLLAREDRDVAATIAEILREDGIEVFLETEAVGVTTAPAGGVRLTVRTPSGEHVLVGSRLLVVAGREPNTDGLDLAAAGIAVDARGYIKVNERLETSAPGVYALGGVNGGPAFTHVAYDDLRVIRASVLDNANSNTMGRMCPYTAFTDPQLGRIGLTESEAREQGRTVRVAKPPMNRAARVVDLTGTRGLMKVVIECATDRIIGAAVIGAESGEIMAMLQTAMMADMSYTALGEGMFAHPSLAGSRNNLFAALDG